MLDNARQFARLMKEPQVQSKGTQAFTLRGKVIDVFGRSRLLERVLAKDSASAVNQDLTLTADTVDLRVTGNRLQSAYAFGDPVELARAVTRERTIVAESLHVSMPDQRMRELHAVGQAYAESDPDTTRVSTGERDWLRGDTIVALFDTAAVRDTAAQRDSTRQPPLRELTAQGSASSFYQIPSDKGGKDRPGLNYVRGAAIRIAFSAREVQTVTVDKQAAGLFLEPATDSTAARPPAPPPRRPPT
jgi:hypothetical protein